jgi:NADH-quinone oxidoreductase subunit N
VTLSDIKDLNSSHPWIALIMLFSMFSMVGIPPFIGFYAKWIVLSELLNAGMLSVSITAIIMSVIAAFYYLRVVWYMYFEKTELPVMQKGSTLIQKSTLSIIGVMILLMGLYPSPMIDFCKSIISPFILID